MKELKNGFDKAGGMLAIATAFVLGVAIISGGCTVVFKWIIWVWNW